MDKTTRLSMEDHFGHDFSRVRVHADARAAESAGVVHAHAYTVGHHVVFGAGRYAPTEPTGRHLLAHELTHVVQQQSGRGADLQRLADSGDSLENDALEQQADAMADALAKEDRKNKGGQHKADQHGKKTKQKAAAKNPCTRTIFSEGTCQDLVDGAANRCCDPVNGLVKKRAVAKDVDGIDCPSNKFTPGFTCEAKCKDSLKKGCDDNDNWMAVPRNQFTRAQCGDVWTICANGKSTTGYVRDKSVTQTRFEVSPGIQKALGVTLGSSFKGSIFRPGASQQAIDKDACCNTPKDAKGADQSSGDASDADEALA
ncbi:DUF4157 domain-containing protein [Dyella choica]|uniref:eCIS core domain-containing protein n=1 Tax=Dyella choica TaxID=1927959 RepID=UPI001E515770|nr:DUF4157 domain-containing protein [Dyella choica]